MLALLLFSLQFKPVQTYIAKKAAAYLSNELHTTVAIGGLYVKPFKSLVLDEFLVLDLEKDTLAYFPKFTVNLNKLSLKERVISVNTLQINNGTFFLKDYKDKQTNLDFIIDYFDSGPPPAVKKKKYILRADRIVLNNLHFRYKNTTRNEKINGVNFDDIDTRSLNGIFENLSNETHFFQTKIKNLTFKEKSGFYLKDLSTDATIDSNQIELKNLFLSTQKTRLTDYYRMRFSHFSDFKDYENKVDMRANFKNSFISSSDIAYFAPALKKMKLEIDIDGQISGMVNDLKAKQLTIKAGDATYLKGNFSLKGLPHWENTFIDMKIEMAGTNKKDLDGLLTDIAGKPVKDIPTIVEKFGNVNFSGSFTGFQNDFIAFGEFKTQLGRLQSDVNMKIDAKGIPSYTGTVKTFDFHIGELLDESDLGQLSSSLAIEGRGTDIKQLTEKLKGHVDYIDFKKYRYQNVTVNGTFDKQLFDGNLLINDPNVQLAFDGSVNLNPELPVFRFKADIKNAALKSLNLVKDSMQIDASFSTNFSGNNLNNIQGRLLVDRIKLNNKEGQYNIDSILIKADGTGVNRLLAINSDILDASIKGQYDLNTIVSYYKAIAKTYIPSLETQIITYKPQIFNFDLRIKQFAPIAELVAPGLALDNEAILIGNFDSRNNIATLNGFISKLSYKGIVANNIIVDENTTGKQLQASITSDRVDLSDSLFIKNVNIVNILRNDSLSLNVKLSDADDANQLDLNGLVEFLADTTAKISILPSNLKIANDDWNIQEKVRISFNRGKTEISNFDLSNGKQLLTIDGILSDDPRDLLELGFSQFNLATLNPFLKSQGISLSGLVNGKTSFYNVLKSPKITDNITIDSLKLNDVDVGQLTDYSYFDQLEGAAQLSTRIANQNRETFRIKGGIDLNSKEMDVNLRMDRSELVVPEPFIDNLVSNLKGGISANLEIKGQLKNPSINGNVSFDNGQLTVNYLKTTFTLDKSVDIKNNIVQIKELALKDPEGNQGIANGTVDLNDPNNPDIQVSLTAKNLIALNTTSKDNNLYYGKAYATGTFTFRGPTDNMLIDIDAKTEKGTVFNLPLNSTETVSDKDFITFVSKDTTRIMPSKSSFNGLRMNFKLKVDPNSTANIYTVLGKLTGKGNAELELNISSIGDFEMKGDYIIESGYFDFTAQEVINKRFDIRQGGTIRWIGNPSNAQINLKAVYALRASLKDLYTAANSDNTSVQRVQTEVEMSLNGSLMDPKPTLDISFPANPTVKEELQAYFNDGNNLNKQALSLIVQRRFAPGAGGKENFAQQLGSIGTGAASDLLFNQLNNMFSSLNLTAVDINIRSLNEFSGTTKLFNDRIIINLGIVDKASESDFSPIGFNKNNVGREIEILGMIKKDGTLIGKLANKPPTQQSVFANPGIDPNLNVFSLGILYNQQFDTFKEFLQKITGKYRREQMRKEAAEKERMSKDAILEESRKSKAQDSKPSKNK